MKIKVGLNKQSVKNAINALKTAKKQLQGEMLNEFYKRCYDYFVSRATQHLNSSDIGDNIKDKINNSWSFVKATTGIKIINDAIFTRVIDGRPQEVPIAILVEFGSGIVGQGTPHPNASSESYEYNVNSGKKDTDGTWRFYRDKESLDLPTNALLSGTRYLGNGRYFVETQGTKGVWFAFNALEDLRLAYKQIWEEIKIKYWG